MHKKLLINQSAEFFFFSIVRKLNYAVLFCFFLLWIASLTKTSFFADDYGFLKLYWKDLNLESGNTGNAGRYIVNIFFAFGTTIFGSGSAIPFEVISGSLLLAGLWLIAKSTSEKSHENLWSLQIFTIVTVFGGTLPLLLWSAGITHTGAIFFTGLSLFTFRKSKAVSNPNSEFLLVVVSGIFGIFVIVSNPLYVGVLVISIFHIFDFSRNALSTPDPKIKVKVFVVSTFGAIIPLAYFFLIAYPVTTKMTPYSKSGIKYIKNNIDNYANSLFWTSIVKSFFILICLSSLILALLIFRRNQKAIAYFLAAAMTFGAILVQGQQQAVFYLVLPFILMLTSLKISFGDRQFLGPYLFSIFLFLFLIATIISGSRINSYFSSEPWGYKLKPLISEIEKVVAPGKNLFICFIGSQSQYSKFVASYSGTSAFEIPPIKAATVMLANNSCAPQDGFIAIEVSETDSGFYSKDK